MLLIHGLAATNRYWSAHFDEIEPDGQVMAVDLAGFGAADRAGPFGLDDQVDAIIDLTDQFGVRSMRVAAHSYGSLIALRLAARSPTLVRSIVLFGPALYRDRATAAHRIGRSGSMARLGLVHGPLARIGCAAVCRFPTMSGWLAERLRTDLPRPVARDAAAHSWAGYSAALAEILSADGPALLRTVAVPVTLVVGAGDRVVDRVWLSTGGNGRVSFEEWPGHHLPVRDPLTAARHVAAADEG